MIRRFIPITLLFLLMSAAYLTGFFQVVNFDTLRYLHVEMVEYANNHPLMTPLILMGYTAGSILLSMPGGWISGVIMGFLFSQPWCTIYFIIGTTLGSSLLFLAVKLAFGNRLKFHGLQKLQEHFHAHLISYLLFLRLVPFLPFWAATLIPAFLKVRLRTFIWTTALGILPKALILTEAGKGFNAIFEEAEKFSLSTVFSFDVQMILLSLALFSLLPILIKKLARNPRNS